MRKLGLIGGMSRVSTRTYYEHINRIVQPRTSRLAGVPVIHIADCVGRRMEANRVKTAALIGTRNVMLEDFYRKRLAAHGFSLLPPVMGNVDEIERVIYEELMQAEPRARPSGCSRR